MADSTESIQISMIKESGIIDMVDLGRQLIAPEEEFYRQFQSNQDSDHVMDRDLKAPFLLRSLFRLFY